MIGKIVLSICLITFLNAKERVFLDKKIYKIHKDAKGTHIIYTERFSLNTKYNEKIKKIYSYANNLLEWSLEDRDYLTKSISKYSVIDDYDKDGINDIILVYGFSSFGKFKNSDIEHYVDFELAIIYRNKIAKIRHHPDADDCSRYTEVDMSFYTFPQEVIDKTVKVLENIESIHYIPIVNDFKTQIEKKYKYLWEYDCGKVKPWNDNEFGYIDFDGKKKVILYESFKSLFDYCYQSGIKESEIRKLNPWINKKATNIPLNVEIIIPSINKEKCRAEIP